MPPGSRPSVDRGRGHHLVRREAHVRARLRGRVDRPSQGARARGDSARDRWSAPLARAARRHRQHQGRGLHGAGDHLRPSAGRSRRPDVCDDQCEAHAPQCVAPRQPLGPSAVSRRCIGRGARCRSGTERSTRILRFTARSSCLASATGEWHRHRSRRN